MLASSFFDSTLLLTSNNKRQGPTNSLEEDCGYETGNHHGQHERNETDACAGGVSPIGNLEKHGSVIEHAEKTETKAEVADEYKD